MIKKNQHVHMPIQIHSSRITVQRSYHNSSLSILYLTLISLWESVFYKQHSFEIVAGLQVIEIRDLTNFFSSMLCCLREMWYDDISPLLEKLTFIESSSDVKKLIKLNFTYLITYAHSLQFQLSFLNFDFSLKYND